MHDHFINTYQSELTLWLENNAIKILTLNLKDIAISADEKLFIYALE